MPMTVADLRKALEGLPDDLEVALSYPDLKNPGMQYETRDVRFSGVHPDGAGQSKPCVFLDAWDGI